ncbi:MAG: hypothetical protein ACTHLA_15275 [Asticcacaulis sp.]|uniref:hypothetical protein n=1 Tax=Asticcacaulis sp. TaxID=1872648 RepID=UPI003F7CBAC0
MSSHAPIAQPQLTPEERRAYLRAFADRMLLKLAAMDDPEDLPGVERAVRAASVVERLYSRCDRAERGDDDPRKLRAERARNESEAIRAQVSLADTLKWGEERRRNLGPWWDAAAEKAAAPAAVSPAAAKPVETPQMPKVAPKTEPKTETETAPKTETANPPKVAPEVTYVDYTDAIAAWRVELGLDPPPP